MYTQFPAHFSYVSTSSKMRFISTDLNSYSNKLLIVKVVDCCSLTRNINMYYNKLIIVENNKYCKTVNQLKHSVYSSVMFTVCTRSKT